MKRAFLIALMLVSIASTATAQKIRIAAMEWEPYTGEKIEGKGLLSAICVEALKRAGYDSEIIIYPWARAVEETKLGNTEALLGASYLKERTEFFAYPDEVWINRVGFFTQKSRADKKSFSTIEALAPATVGVLNGSNFIEVLKKVKGITVATGPTVESNIMKVATGRIDYLIEDKTSVEYLLSTKLPELKEKLKFIEPQYSLDKIYLVFSKKSPNSATLVSDFNKGLAQMKKDGSINKLAKKYGVKSK